MNDQKLLILGGAGYIGTVLTQRLLSNGFHVRCIDMLLYGHRDSIQPFMCNIDYEFIYSDIADVEIVNRSLEGISTVILLAGLVGDPITKKYPQVSAKINDESIKNIIDLCTEKGLDRLIFVSTCSNYGLINNDGFADEQYQLNPLSLYAKSKVNAESYILSLKGNTTMNPTILRFATAFGLSPRMRFDLTVNEFTRELVIGNELLVYDAHTWRPYCHVEDFARLIQMVIEAPTKEVSFEVFNAGGDVNNATKQMIVDTILGKIPGGKVRFKEHGSDPRNYRVSFEKVKSVLGFEPKYTIQDGIDELI